MDIGGRCNVEFVQFVDCSDKTVNANYPKPNISPCKVVSCFVKVVKSKKIVYLIIRCKIK